MLGVCFVVGCFVSGLFSRFGSLGHRVFGSSLGLFDGLLSSSFSLGNGLFGVFNRFFDSVFSSSLGLFDSLLSSSFSLGDRFFRGFFHFCDGLFGLRNGFSLSLFSSSFSLGGGFFHSFGDVCSFFGDIEGFFDDGFGLCDEGLRSGNGFFDSCDAARNPSAVASLPVTLRYLPAGRSAFGTRKCIGNSSAVSPKL